MESERWARRALGLLALSAALAIGSTAGAGEPSDTDRETARALMDEGDQAFDAKDWTKALERYRAAHALVALPSTGIWVAKAHEKLGHLVEARELCLEIGRLPVKPKERDVIVAARSEAADLAEKLAARIPSIAVAVAGVKPEQRYRLFVDDGEVAAQALGVPYRVNPGKHAVRVEADGFKAAHGEITLSEGQPGQLSLTLEPAGGPGGAPKEDAPASGGIHPLVWAGVGVTGAGLLAGAIGGGISLSSASSAKEQCDGNLCPPAAQSDIDLSKSTAWVSNVGFGVAGAGAVLLVVGLVLPTSPGPTTTGLAPCAGPGGTFGACLTF